MGVDVASDFELAGGWDKQTHTLTHTHTHTHTLTHPLTHT